MERKKVKLLGFGIDTFDFKGAVNYAMNLIETKKGGQVVTINPEMIEFGLKNPEFANILNNADLVIPDGVGVKIGLKIKGINAQRIAGIEFSHKMIEECAKNNFSVALIGAKPHILEKTIKNLQSDFKDLNIIYTQDGYFKNVNDVYVSLGEKNPQFVLVATGSPKQEIFIKEYRKYHPDAVMIGVGGSFDVWSGEVERAPEIYQKLGLEWLYRTLKEPQRFKRIFPTLPRFILRVLLSKKQK
jgi:N-acetylglucosaminyldiphosphoundecaprenol N-acetyl-beta-D-mannosaminyltransferase